MTTGLRIAAALILVLTGFKPAIADTHTGDTPNGLLVIYGAIAPSREGDTDRREQVFFSVPSDLRDRFYVRVFDPEVFGDNDFIYGVTSNADTVFRVFGGQGAFSMANRPVPVKDGTREPRHVKVDPVTGPGRLLKETAWSNGKQTDGRWVNLTSLRASQGEVIDGRSFFRIDVQGVGGDDGNGFSLEVSQARDRNRRPDGLDMFAYRPTVRWLKGQPATQLWFTPKTGGPFSVQNYDAANGSINLVTDYADLPLRASAQGFWTIDSVDTDDTNLAISIKGGFETPNDLTLAVFDAAGNPVPLQMPPRPAPAPDRPLAIATARPLADCRTVAFDASASTGLTPLSYLWAFGDGASLDQPVIARRYDRPGRYTARLRVLERGTRPGRGAEIEVPVHIRDAPTAVPGPDVTVAPGQMLAFDGTGSIASDSPITRYGWSFGDGTVASGARTQKAYAQPGLYRATLRVEDDSNHPCDFGVQTRKVTVNAAPVAEAGADRSTIIGAPVTFTGGASYDIDGVIRSYSWDMGNGTVLDGATVTYSYPDSGIFSVALTVTDDSNVANNTTIDRMRVTVNAPPEPRFTIPARPVSVSEAAIMDASASVDPDGEILSYEWDFGDGATGTGKIVEYAWNRAGVFQVTLRVVDDSGTTSGAQVLTMPVRVDAAPVADAGPDQFVTASDVTFYGGGSTDTDGTVTNWQWDFGDGTTARGKQVTHAYLRPGTYQVALVVRDDSTAPLNTDRDTLQVVVNAAPIADAGPPQTVVPGEEFIVSGVGSVDPDGTIAKYVWSFPDGSETSGIRAAHSFADPGLYRVRLAVYDDFRGGAAMDESEVLITVNAQPVAIAGADLLIAPGETVTFDASQSFDPDGSLTSYRWAFDDSDTPLNTMIVERAYVTPGIWSAQLVVTDNSGTVNATASDSRTIRVNTAPIAEAGPPVTSDQLQIELDASGSGDADGDALIYSWDFGDGSAPTLGRLVTHVYARSGIFPVTLQVDDGTGVANATSSDATTVTINARPLAVAGGNREACSGAPILFDATGSSDPDGGSLLFSWDFGDGTGSDLINPTKTYERPGTYPVTLRVRNETGTIRGTSVDRIAALISEGPIADAGGDRTVGTNQQVRFDGSGSTDADGTVNAFSWNFGDGKSGRGERPVHVFERPGTYAVTLTITGEARGLCSPLDTDVATITVLPAPKLAIQAYDRAAAGLATEFTADLTQLGGASIVGFDWQFGDGTSSTGATATHIFTQPGEFLVDLTATLSGGDTGRDTLSIRRKIVVNAAPRPQIDAPDMVAAGQAVTFDAETSDDSDGVITQFIWDFGDNTNATGVRVGHRYENPGTYTVALTVVDDAGVANSRITKTQMITVNPAPFAGLQTPPALCPATDVLWSVTTAKGTTVDWAFGDGFTASGTSISHGFAEPGLFSVQVTMDDGAGLQDSLRREEVYARVNAAPTAFAGPDRVVCPGDTVTFDAGPSSDLDGRITEWRWAFSDGTTLEGPSVQRVFDSPADLLVRLSVKDDSGALACSVGTDTARIKVNATPQVDAGPDQSVLIGAAHDVVRFDASSASDPDKQGLRIEWDYGDGQRATGAVTRHRFTTPGTYTVTVQARDATGLACGVATDTAVVTATARE